MSQFRELLSTYLKPLQTKNMVGKDMENKEDPVKEVGQAKHSLNPCNHELLFFFFCNIWVLRRMPINVWPNFANPWLSFFVP